MMKVLVTLVRVGREECARSRFRFFEEVPSGVREREDMMSQHIAPSIPKYSGIAYAEVLALIVREMLLEYILVTHSPPLSGHFLCLRLNFAHRFLAALPILALAAADMTRFFSTLISLLVKLLKAFAAARTPFN